MNRPVNVDRFFMQKLSPTHDRLDFDCGNIHLNRYLKKQANQDIKRKISQVFIASPETHQEKIYGFYTLSSLSIQLDSLPEKLAKKLPRHPVPSALIGRLACDVKHKGEGIGKLLLANAIHRTLTVSEQMGIYAMVVDAKDDAAVGFYQHYGFMPLAKNTDCESKTRLFIPLKSI